MINRGIILAGGLGTRLHPMTLTTNKQLLPVYNKPMIYYPLSTLMLAGIREYLLISTPQCLRGFMQLLSDGQRLGISISYRSQIVPRGIADALLIADEWACAEPTALILGDNLFYGKLDPVRDAIKNFDRGATIFGYPVHDPERYGVVEFDEDGGVETIVEKPTHPKSRYAVPGLYLYDASAADRVGGLKPSERGELEITDLNLAYLRDGLLSCAKLGRGLAWLDTGTPSALLDAARFIEAVETRQGLMVGCPEEITIAQGWVDTVRLLDRMLDPLPSGPYRDYVEQVWEER